MSAFKQVAPSLLPDPSPTGISQEDVLEKARKFYGYGRWQAPYWFVGPEEGMSPSEQGSQKQRIRAWQAMEKPEICDCRAFHEAANIHAHHTNHPALVPTWRALLLTLAVLKGNPTDVESLRTYQRDRWGMEHDETCIIELSGIPAKGFHIKQDRKIYLKERSNVISDRLREHSPSFVVMYGWGNREHYKKIIDTSIRERNISGRLATFAQLGETRIAITAHPAAFGVKNDYWEQIGEYLRSPLR